MIATEIKRSEGKFIFRPFIYLFVRSFVPFWCWDGIRGLGLCVVYENWMDLCVFDSSDPGVRLHMPNKWLRANGQHCDVYFVVFSLAITCSTIGFWMLTSNCGNRIISSSTNGTLLELQFLHAFCIRNCVQLLLYTRKKVFYFWNSSFPFFQCFDFYFSFETFTLFLTHPFRKLYTIALSFVLFLSKIYHSRTSINV